jgi:hypothetical protein
MPEPSGDVARSALPVSGSSLIQILEDLMKLGRSSDHS